MSGKKENRHPHTFWCRIIIKKDAQGFVPFYEYEKRVHSYFENYRGKYLNETETFKDVIPTLETMASLFYIDVEEIFNSEPNYTLEQLEIGDSPSRSVLMGRAIFIGDEMREYSSFDVNEVAKIRRERFCL